MHFNGPAARWLVISWWGVLQMWNWDVRWRRWGWIGVVLVMLLFEHGPLLLFLLMKDLDGILEFRKSCSFSVYALPLGFCTLNCCLPPHDGFLFLIEPFDLLLDSNQLLFSGFVFKGFFFPIFHLELLQVYVVLDYLN
jgi:hypothetical protein